MISNDLVRRSSRWCRRGLSLLEMLVSIPLVGVAIVAALNAAGASRASQFKVSIASEGQLLARELMAEILQQDYADAATVPVVQDAIFLNGTATYSIGRDPSESGANRADFDDVDDYDKWSATPPEAKDGTVLANLAGWERQVQVVFANSNNLQAIRADDEGSKRVTVSVMYNGVIAAELVAVTTVGLPRLEACCFGGLCEDLRVEACTTEGGTSMGADTNCANTECATGPRVLFVVADTAALTAQESIRQSLMEAWGFRVQLISASASQSAFDAAVASADVAYISVEVVAADLLTKLTSAPIGVVNANPPLMDDLAFYSGSAFYVFVMAADVTDNSHYITSTFPLGTLAVSTSDQDFMDIVSGLAAGAQVLGLTSGKDALFVFEAGALLLGGTPAPARRVQLPWGGVGFDFNALSADGKTLVKRAIEWAARLDVVCGDGTCDVGEACDCPSDCGAPASFEQPGATCADGLDNDCDGQVDCADADCSADVACTVCGDSVCETGEDCNSCPTDCPSGKGNASKKYCCGNGIAELAEGDGTICDGNY